MILKNDQAEHLRKKTANIENIESTFSSSLPSRSEVHGRKRENKKDEQSDKKQKKQTFLITRLLLFAFIVLIGLTLTYKYWAIKINLPVQSDNKGIQQVNIEN
jgi:hypothetical protein